MNGRHDQAWLERTQALLDASLQEIDAATLARLQRARRAALEQRAPTQRAAWFGLGLVGASAMLLLGLGLARHVAPPIAVPAPAQHAPVAQVDDPGAALAPEEEDGDFYENLDFYAWLAASQTTDQG